MRIVALANQKGGCGKTTTAVNLAACLAFLQKKTLLVDLDPQGHSTCGLGIEAEKRRYSLYDLLKTGISHRPELSQVRVQAAENLDLLPAYVILNRIEEEYASLPGWEKPLKKLLTSEALKQNEYDFVVIDCPPNLGVLTYNALMAAEDVIIPVEPSFYSLHGLAKISETLEQISAKRNQTLEVHALMTLFVSGASFAEEVYQDVRSHFKQKLFKTLIHTHMSLREAAAQGQSILAYDNRCDAAREYLYLATEYLERTWKLEIPEEKTGWRNAFRNRLGPRRVVGGTLFQVFNPDARSVEIAGDFNHWIPQDLRHRGKEGLWQIVLPLQDGRYRYKFIVDGEWQIDPYQPFHKKNGYGSFDSYLELGGVL